jgi:hypothetical protein
MWIIGVDYHPSVQQIAFVNTDTGECGERRLNHSDGEAAVQARHMLSAIQPDDDNGRIEMGCTSIASSTLVV